MLFIIICLLLFPLLGAASADVYVPDDYSTIQAAIDGASSGATIVVRNGTYRESIDFHGKTVTVRSEQGPSAAIIRGSVTFRGTGTAPVLDGFTVTSLGDRDHWSDGRWCINNWEGCTSTEGVGVYCESGNPMVRNCIITGHEGFCVGGVYCGPNTSPTFTNCIIRYNHGGHTGGVACFKASPTFINCIINRNAGCVVGAIRATNSSRLTLVNCTMADNAAATASTGLLHDLPYPGPMCPSGFAGGIGLWSSSVTAVNCIFWNDRRATCHDDPNNEILSFDDENCSVNITHSNIEGYWKKGAYWEPLPEGIGNINRDPDFLGDGDYRLGKSSPCIDAGTNGAPGLPELDFAGNPRILNGNNDDIATVDMGAYETGEFDPSLFVADFTADSPYGMAWHYNAYTHTVHFTDLTAGVVTSWLWDFGDGGTSTEQNPSHTYIYPGDYTVSLTATSPGGSDSRIVEHCVRIGEWPVILAIEPNETCEPGDEVMIVGVWDPSTSLTAMESQGDSSVTIGETTYGPGNPNILEWVTLGENGASDIRLIVPSYGWSVFEGLPSITKDVSVTVRKHITSNASFDEIKTNTLALTILKPPCMLEFAWPEKVKAFDRYYTPPQEGTAFKPGTNLEFQIKATLQGDAGKLYRAKLQGKIILPYLPVGDPNRVIKLTDTNGNAAHIIKNVAPGNMVDLKLVGQLPGYAKVGKNFKFNGTITLFQMGSSTALQTYSVIRTFPIVQ